MDGNVQDMVSLEFLSKVVNMKVLSDQSSKYLLLVSMVT